MNLEQELEGDVIELKAISQEFIRNESTRNKNVTAITESVESNPIVPAQYGIMRTLVSPVIDENLSCRRSKRQRNVIESFSSFV